MAWYVDGLDDGRIRRWTSIVDDDAETGAVGHEHQARKQKKARRQPGQAGDDGAGGHPFRMSVRRRALEHGLADHGERRQQMHEELSTQLRYWNASMPNWQAWAGPVRTPC